MECKLRLLITICFFVPLAECAAQTSTALEFARMVEQAAKNSEKLWTSKDVESTRELLLIPVGERSPTPQEFVGSLRSNFELKELILLLAYESKSLPQFVPVPFDSKKPETVRRNAWLEETSRLYCLRMLSDAEFRSSILRLSTWRSTRLYSEELGFTQLTSEVVIEYCQPKATNFDSPTFWQNYLEVLSIAYLVGYPTEIDVTKFLRQQDEFRAEVAKLADFVTSNEFVASTTKIGWEVGESAGIAGLSGRTSRAKIPIQAIEKMPESLKQKEIVKLMRAILRD